MSLPILFVIFSGNHIAEYFSSIVKTYKHFSEINEKKILCSFDVEFFHWHELLTDSVNLDLPYKLRLVVKDCEASSSTMLIYYGRNIETPYSEWNKDERSDLFVK